MRLLIGLLFLGCAGRALAHDPGLSSANLRLQPGKISAIVTFNDRDISTVLGDDPEAVRRGGSVIQAKLDLLARRVLSF